jgi:hypothetical protein
VLQAPCLYSAENFGLYQGNLTRDSINLAIGQSAAGERRASSEEWIMSRR